MGLYSDIEKAQVTLGGNWLKPGGKYLCCISAVKEVTSYKKKKLYTVELEVLESNMPEIRPGARASWQANITDHGLTALGNVRGFLAAAIPCPVDGVDEALVEMSISAANPIKGQLVSVETNTIKTREKNQDFTKHVWSPVDPTVQAKAQELRKACGFKDAA